jgi:hypothetical protein
MVMINCIYDETPTPNNQVELELVKENIDRGCHD